MPSYFNLEFKYFKSPQNCLYSSLDSKKTQYDKALKMKIDLILIEPKCHSRKDMFPGTNTFFWNTWSGSINTPLQLYKWNFI